MGRRPQAVRDEDAPRIGARVERRELEVGRVLHLDAAVFLDEIARPVDGGVPAAQHCDALPREVIEAQLRATRQRVRARDGRKDGGFAQGHDVVCAPGSACPVVGGIRARHDVHLRAQRANDRAVLRPHVADGHELEAQPRQGVVYLLPARQHEAARAQHGDAEAHEALVGACGHAHAAQCVVGQAHHRARVVQQALAGRRERRPLARAREQGRAARRLEGPDLLEQGRRRQGQKLRGLGEAACLGGGNEGVEPVVIEHERRSPHVIKPTRH